ncbi:MAG: phenylalanine--tRNA ligase subunit alpha, partial [Clostridia bacterium]|nr:phenylalanine--tRNA ligase subunit alpha [Clostridia bacterium]
MKEQLQNIKASAQAEINEILSAEQLEAFRVKYLGKKGVLTDVLKGMGKLSAEERPVIGQLANEIRNFLEDIVSKMQTEIKAKELEEKIKSEKIDITMPGEKFVTGGRHPL